MKESKTKNRIQYLDIARGIAILLMITGHCILKQGDFFFNLIYSFHMPLFVLVSGYFFHENEKFSVTIKKSVKLMLIMTVAQIVVFSVTDLYFQLPYTQKDYAKTFVVMLIEPTRLSFAELWFIPFLVCNKILFTGVFHLVKRTGTEKNILIRMGVVCFPLAIFGYWCGKMQYNLSFRFDVSLTCLALTFLGYLAKKKELLPKLCQPKVILVLLPIWLCLAKFLPITDLATRQYGPFGMGLLNAVCGTIIVCALSKKIEEKLPSLGNGFAFCGKYSLYILIFNFIENKTLFKFIYRPASRGESTVLQILGAVVASILLVGIQKRIKRTKASYKFIEKIEDCEKANQSI